MMCFSVSLTKRNFSKKMRKILQSLGLVDDKSSQDSTSKCDKKTQNKPTITFEYKLDERSCVGKDFQRGKVFVRTRNRESSLSRVKYFSHRIQDTFTHIYIRTFQHTT